jgi:glutathione S-transferase
MKLLIANKNYSSWSLRAWLTLRAFDIPFEEETLLLNGTGWKEAIQARSPSGQVPVLIDGDLVIPETLAIIEYVAERFPDKAIWPRETRDRALARSASAEMHGGFSALRNAAPMNLRASYPNRVAIDDVADNLSRIERLWGGLLETSGGPFLFGNFSAADAMFAPVATRIRTYQLPVSDTALKYVDAIYALPSFQEWLGEALKEPWTVDQDEIDVIQGKPAK